MAVQCREPLATRRLGRTEHQSSVAILGGAAFWGRHSRSHRGDASTLALDAGVNHLDIAPSYGHAELVVGPLVPAVRDRLFIGEKSNRTNPDGLRAQLETSLERLGCDSFDLYQAHGVTDLAELDRRSPPSRPSCRPATRASTRFVGITGTTSAPPPRSWRRCAASTSTRDAAGVPRRAWPTRSTQPTWPRCSTRRPAATSP